MTGTLPPQELEAKLREEIRELSLLLVECSNLITEDIGYPNNDYERDLVKRVRAALKVEND